MSIKNINAEELRKMKETAEKKKSDDGLSDSVSLKETDMLYILDRIATEHGLSYTESCFDRLDGKLPKKEKARL